MNGWEKILQERRRVKRQLLISRVLVVAIFVGLTAFVCLSEPEAEVDTQLAYYCEMVDIHKEGLKTGDAGLGWPDFKAIYGEECR